MAWRVAHSLEVLLAQLNARYPRRSKISDGSIGDAAHATRDSDHNPWYGPGIVTARDYTHDPANGVDIDRLSDELQASRDPRIKYVIANRLIMSGAAGPQPWVWRRYTGANPHTHHLHLSVVADPRCDDPRPWALPMLQAPAPVQPPPPPEEDIMATKDELRQILREEIMDAQVKRGGAGQTGTTTLRSWIAYFDHAFSLGRAGAEAQAAAVLAAIKALSAAGPDLTEQQIVDALTQGAAQAVRDQVLPVLEDVVAQALGADNEALAAEIVRLAGERLRAGA